MATAYWRPPWPSPLPRQLAEAEVHGIQDLLLYVGIVHRRACPPRLTRIARTAPSILAQRSSTTVTILGVPFRDSYRARCRYHFPVDQPEQSPFHRERALQEDRATRGLVIFDGDDTLWETMPAYANAKDRFFRQISDWGYPESTARPLLETIDVQNVGALRFSRQRFPRSMVETYRELCKRAGQTPDPDREEIAFQIGDGVFSTRMPLLMSAREVLEKLRPHYLLVLCTKGDFAVQHERVTHSGVSFAFRLFSTAS